MEVVVLVLVLVLVLVVEVVVVVVEMKMAKMVAMVVVKGHLVVYQGAREGWRVAMCWYRRHM